MFVTLAKMRIVVNGEKIEEWAQFHHIKDLNADEKITLAHSQMIDKYAGHNVTYTHVDGMATQSAKDGE